MTRQVSLTRAKEQIQQALEISLNDPGTLSVFETIAGRMNPEQEAPPING